MPEPKRNHILIRADQANEVIDNTPGEIVAIVVNNKTEANVAESIELYNASSHPADGRNSDAYLGTYNLETIQNGSHVDLGMPYDNLYIISHFTGTVETNRNEILIITYKPAG